MKLPILLILLGTSTAAISDSPKFTYSADGSEAIDTKTGLIWQRCNAGQIWDQGKCTGASEWLTHEQALAYAAKYTGWRIPNVKELASIVDTNRKLPAADKITFPTIVSEGFYWTSTPVSGDSKYAWVIHFSHGEVLMTDGRSGTRREDKNHFKLVR